MFKNTHSKIRDITLLLNVKNVILKIHYLSILYHFF